MGLTTEILKEKNRVVEGLNEAADAVTSTMGGQGKTVLISDERGNRFTKDGVSVARSITFEDRKKNVGAQMVKSAATKTVAGPADGTTLTTVLLRGLVNKIFENDSYTKNLSQTIKSLKEGRDIIIDELRASSNKISSSQDVYNIAATSANAPEIGDFFKEIVDKVNDFDIQFSLERSELADKSYYEITSGLSFDSGYAHPSFMTDKMTEQAIYENAFVYATTQPIATLTPELEAMMDESMQNGVPLVIIAPRYSDSIIRLATMNKINQNAQFLMLKLPGWAIAAERNVEDIMSFVDSDGFVDKVVATPTEFTLYNSNPAGVKERITVLKSLIEYVEDRYEVEDMEKRIHRLKGTSVIIYAGGVTPEELSEEYDRLEDAVGSVKSALKGGYSLGAGLELVYIWNRVSSKVDKIFSILIDPYNQILWNANMKRDVYLTEKNYGFDVKTGKEVNLLEAGIIDSTEVLVEAIKNSVSIATLFANTNFVLINTGQESNSNGPFKFQ